MTQNKKLGIRSIVLMVLTACLAIRWVAAAGAIGPSAITFWIIATIIFFIPLNLIVVELSLNYKDNGGIYLWTREGLGREYSFYTAWLYWICNIFYYPGILTFIAANILYLSNSHNLANNKHLIVVIVISCFWISVLFNIRGINLIAKISIFTGLFNFRLGIFLIIAGFCYLISHQNSATSFTLRSFMPDMDIIHNLSNLSLLMFALSGIELIPTVYKSIDNPERNLKKAIIISMFLLLTLYIIGTITINFILSPTELSSSTGLVASFFTLTAKLHWSSWVAYFLVLSLVIVEFGSFNIWLIAPTIMFFHCAEQGILPESLRQLNNNYAPRNALIFQAALSTVIILLSQYLPTVNSMYMLLVLAAANIYFIPYLFLAIAYLKLRRHNQLSKTILPKFLGILAPILLMISISLTMFLSFIPTSDVKSKSQIIVYEAELIGGPLVFTIIGMLMYKRRKSVVTQSN